MRTEDLRNISQLSKAFWVDSDYSDYMSKEALSAVSVMNLNEEKALERATQALLVRAHKDNAQKNKIALNHPFYRLFPLERFILVSLHVNRWSYARMAQILKETPRTIAEHAWKIRTNLAAQNGIIYPTGNKIAGHSCPEYVEKNPWTQKFLDEEMPNRERLFMQNHLMVCTSCRMTLARCRDFYFKIEALIPRLTDEEKIVRKVKSYSKIIQKTRLALNKSEATFLGSLRIFFKRRDVQIITAILAIYIFSWITK